MNIQSWFPLGWTDLISRQSKGLSSLLQHHSLKASVLWRSAFIMVQLSNPYMTTGKTIALTIRTFVGKVMSLLFNTLSKFVIAFLPRSKRLGPKSQALISPHQYKSGSISGRNCVSDQRDHFTAKGLYSQNYGFSSSQVQMWELDHKEGWVPKKGCFQVGVLEKTLESLGHQGDQTSPS